MRRGRLYVLGGREAGVTFELPPEGSEPGAELVVGRESGCALRIRDRSISRRHARLDFEDGYWVIRDLRSRNGVLFEGERVARLELEDGAELVLGEVPVRFRDVATLEASELEASAPEAGTRSPGAAHGSTAPRASAATPARDRSRAPGPAGELEIEEEVDLSAPARGGPAAAAPLPSRPAGSSAPDERPRWERSSFLRADFDEQPLWKRVLIVLALVALMATLAGLAFVGVRGLRGGGF